MNIVATHPSHCRSTTSDEPRESQATLKEFCDEFLHQLSIEELLGVNDANDVDAPEEFKLNLLQYHIASRPLGVVTAVHPDEPNILVTKVSGAAKTEGIQVGDQIVAINGGESFSLFFPSFIFRHIATHNNNTNCPHHHF
jgi:predicted metalloprotease with PDZ domain